MMDPDMGARSPSSTCANPCVGCGSSGCVAGKTPFKSGSHRIIFGGGPCGALLHHFMMGRTKEKPVHVALPASCRDVDGRQAWKGLRMHLYLPCLVSSTPTFRPWPDVVVIVIVLLLATDPGAISAIVDAGALLTLLLTDSTRSSLTVGPVN